MIRPAVEADVPHIRRLVRGLADYERLLHKATATEDDFRTAMFGPSPSAHAFLAELPDLPPVGMALFYYTFGTFTCRRGIFLEDLFVEPAHRGTGLGLALLRHLAAHAIEEGCSGIEWRVLNWNQPSITFYESLGATKMIDWQVRQLDEPAMTALAKGERHG